MQKKSLILLCVLLFLLGIASRLAALTVLRVKPSLDFAECELIAKSIATYNLFGDPYKVPTGATAHHAPAYPFLLSLVFGAFGYGSAGALAMMIMNISFASLQYALVPFLGLFKGSTRALLVAAFLGALVPWRIYKDIRWETSLTGLALLLAVLATLRAWTPPVRSGTASEVFNNPEEHGRVPPRNAAAYFTSRNVLFGLSWGLLFLTCPAALPAFLIVLLLFATKQGWKPAFWAAAICGLTILPWCVRNYVQLGGLVFIRDNFPIEFHVSNNDFASPILTENLVATRDNFFYKMHPYSSEPEARLVAKEGELQYNREKLRETMDWIRTHPSKFVVLTAQRIVDFWTLPGAARIKSWTWVLLELVAFWGIAILLKQNVALGWVMLSVWVGFPLVYYLVQTDSRYHYPLDWSTLVLAAFAAEQLVRKKLRAREPKPALKAEMGSDIEAVA
jgi:hypothetical protein